MLRRPPGFPCQRRRREEKAASCHLAQAVGGPLANVTRVQGDPNSPEQMGRPPVRTRPGGQSW